MSELSLEIANALAERVMRETVSRGYAPIAVALTDGVGELKALARMDGGLPLTARLALAKARTSLAAGKATHELSTVPAGIGEALKHLYGGDFVPEPGGLLLRRDGVVVGGIGVSGATSEEDREVAQVAVDAVLSDAGDSARSKGIDE